MQYVSCISRHLLTRTVWLNWYSTSFRIWGCRFKSCHGQFFPSTLRLLVSKILYLLKNLESIERSNIYVYLVHFRTFHFTVCQPMLQSPTGNISYLLVLSFFCKEFCHYLCNINLFKKLLKVKK